MPFTKLSTQTDNGPGLGATVLGIVAGGIALVGLVAWEIVEALADDEEEDKPSPRND